MAIFGQVHLSQRKSATKFLYMKIVSNKVLRHSLAYLCKIIAGGCPLQREMAVQNDPLPSEMPNFSRFLLAVMTKQVHYVFSSEPKVNSVRCL